MVNNNIAILLSTYNSEEYLSEQINSIISQTVKEWILYIRDDGSSDNTFAIISNYCRLFDNIIHIKDNMNNLGAKKSFIKLLSEVESPYYMFCDHDDVWLPEKIEKTLHKMKEAESKNPLKPVLVFTDLIVVDRNLNIISNSMWEYQKTNPLHSKDVYTLSISNPITGCTIMINRAAKDVSVPMSSKSLMHDLWIALNVSHYGYIDFVNEPTMLYRQHNRNVLGAKKVSFLYYFFRLQSINKLFSDNFELYQMLRSLSFKVNLYKLIYYKLKIVLIKLFT